MNTRPRKTVHSLIPSSNTVLVDLEMPNTTEFEVFEEQFEARLAELEEQFSTFVTRDSFAGAIGR
jgi:hypothetical protein